MWNIPKSQDVTTEKNLQIKKKKAVYLIKNPIPYDLFSSTLNNKECTGCLFLCNDNEWEKSKKIKRIKKVKLS